jgi:hypothetical protein
VPDFFIFRLGLDAHEHCSTHRARRDRVHWCVIPKARYVRLGFPIKSQLTRVPLRQSFPSVLRAVYV